MLEIRLGKRSLPANAVDQHEDIPDDVMALTLRGGVDVLSAGQSP